MKRINRKTNQKLSTESNGRFCNLFSIRNIVIRNIIILASFYYAAFRLATLALFEQNSGAAFSF